MSDESNELDAPPVPVRSLPNEVRAAQHVRHVLETEIQPHRSPLSDVRKPLGREADSSLHSTQRRGQDNPWGYESGDLHLIRIREKGGRSAHAPAQPDGAAAEVGTKLTR